MVATTKRRSSSGPKGAGSFQGGVQIGVGVWKFTNVGIPANGVAGTGTGAGWAGPGSECTDTTNMKLYLNGGTKASPVWKLVTSA
jgi:hypothetical protein